MSLKNYPGAKNGSGVYQSIINLIPPHLIYIELFLGSGAIFKNKLPSHISILNDISRDVCSKWESDNSPGRILLNTEAISWIYGTTSLLNMMLELNFPVFMYLDPPYPFNVRKSKRPIYEHEMSELQHINMLRYLKSAKFNVAISSYKNDLYDSELKNWNCVSFPAMSRQGVVTESLYFNYEYPVELHDYRYLGTNFRERSSIKKSICNLTSKINALPAVNRSAIFDMLNVSPVKE